MFHQTTQFQTVRSANFTKGRANYGQFGGDSGKLISPSVIAVGGLMFITIAFYGGADVWSEACALALIFALAASLKLRGEFVVKREIKHLLAPVVTLAVFSLVQGGVTILILSGMFGESSFLPTSFDLTANFWCAAKFFGLAVLIGFLTCRFHYSMRSLVWTLVIVGNIFAVFGLFRYFLQNAFPETFNWFPLPLLRPNVGFGTFVNQNHFAFSMLMNLGLNAGLLIEGKLTNRLRTVLLVAVILSWTAIVLTASRGGIISSFVVITALILQSFAVRRNRDADSIHLKNNRSFFRAGKTLAIFAALIVAMILGISLIGRERVARRFSEIPMEMTSANDGEGFRRIDVWRASAAMIAEHPFWGVGFGGFRRAVSQYIEISGARTPEAAHNDYLDLAAGGGVFAALCGIWFLVRFFQILKRRLSTQVSPFNRAVRIGAMGAFAGIAAHNFSDYGLQYSGNWLVAAVLLSIVIQAENDNGKQTEDSFQAVPKKNRGIGVICFFSLSIFCVWFGFSQFENSLARVGIQDFAVPTFLFALPFDANYYEAQAAIENKKGNFAAETEYLNRAIRFRPKDEILRLKTGAAAEKLNEFETAENAFREAVMLAPFYGEPHFVLGNFLVRHGRIEEGFAKLRIAAARRPAYFDEILQTARRISGDDFPKVLRLLSPLDQAQTEKTAEQLLVKNEFAALARLLCGTAKFDGGKRVELIQKLFEKKQFMLAEKIFTNKCAVEPNSTLNLIDGDFETRQLERNLGFGWRVGELPDAVRIGFDDETKSSGASSLIIDFDGDYDSLQPLLSQTLIVEKSRRYQFSFADRLDKIVTGGLPVVELILKKNNADSLAGEIKLNTVKDGEWVKNSFEFQTDGQTEALEIRVTRKACGQNLCPIFGRLRLDDFRLIKEK